MILTSFLHTGSFAYYFLLKFFKTTVCFCFFREYNNCLYITYYTFQKAFECCRKFNGFYLEQFNCVLNVRLENDNFKDLAQNELSHLMEMYLLLNKDEMSEVNVAK